MKRVFYLILIGIALTILLIIDCNINIFIINPTPFRIFKNEEFNQTYNVINSKLNTINACIFLLVRNKNLNRLIKTVIEFEKNFNHKFMYPYVMINNEEFTENFKSTIQKYTNSKVEFGLIPKEEWSVPSWIDKSKLKTSLENIPFGINYHHMCRYYSGFFFRHNLTLKYDYYWRLDHDSEFKCEIREDPFLNLKRNNQLYGFTLADVESQYTIPSLWFVVKEWLKKNRKKMPDNNSLEFISNDHGESLNSCMFYNNFELASFSLFRNKDYLDFFDFLDNDGGFFYERWGDAPVRTIYVSIMLNKQQVKLFSNLPYKHAWASNYEIFNDQKIQICKYKLDGCTLRWDLFMNNSKLN